ncbi:MAG: hypothetical protein K2Q34_04995 [Alphaproteobacteria bacterium]|nr:hypothetical protein [Alphaproteobacteria bacterium]
MKNFNKIKYMSQFVFIILLSSHSLHARDVEYETKSHESPTTIIKEDAQKKPQEDLPKITFQSMRTRKEYTILMKEGASLRDYIRSLKKQSLIGKDEGLYNYGDQVFFVQGNSVPFYGNEILTREKVDELNKNNRKVTFVFKAR